MSLLLANKVSVSPSQPYCTAAESLTFCDVRRVGDFLADDGRRTPPKDLADPLTKGGQSWNAYLQAASGEVESACLAGGRYTVADLQNLTPLSELTSGRLSNSDWLLKKMVAMHAYGTLIRDKRGAAEKVEQPGIDWAAGMLKKLRDGEAVFALQENIEAANLQTTFLDEGDFRRMGLATDQASRLFGVRAKHSRLTSRW